VECFLKESNCGVGMLTKKGGRVVLNEAGKSLKEPDRCMACCGESKGEIT